MSCFFLFFSFGVDEALSGVIVSVVILIGVVLLAVCTVLVVIGWFLIVLGSPFTGNLGSPVFFVGVVSSFRVWVLVFSVVASAAVVVFVVVIVALVVAVVTVFVVVPVVSFCGQERAKCPSYLHPQQSGLLPSTTADIVVYRYVMIFGMA